MSERGQSCLLCKVLEFFLLSFWFFVLFFTALRTIPHQTLDYVLRCHLTTKVYHRKLQSARMYLRAAGRGPDTLLARRRHLPLFVAPRCSSPRADGIRRARRTTVLMTTNDKLTGADLSRLGPRLEAVAARAMCCWLIIGCRWPMHNHTRAHWRPITFSFQLMT